MHHHHLNSYRSQQRAVRQPPDLYRPCQNADEYESCRSIEWTRGGAWLSIATVRAGVAKFVGHKVLPYCRRLLYTLYSSYTTNNTRHRFTVHVDGGGVFSRFQAQHGRDGMLRQQARRVPTMGRPDGQRRQSCQHAVLAAGLHRGAGGARAQRCVDIRQTVGGQADGAQTPALRVGRHGGSIGLW